MFVNTTIPALRAAIFALVGMSHLPGQFSGWHHYCFPAHKYACLKGASECGNWPANKPNQNYFRCKPCETRAWFLSKIQTMRSDDIVRAESRRRLGMAEPLDVHSGMKSVHNEFKRKGGVIRVLGNRRDMPIVTWDSTNRLICSARWPDHLVSTEVSSA